MRKYHEKCTPSQRQTPASENMANATHTASIRIFLADKDNHAKKKTPGEEE